MRAKHTTEKNRLIIYDGELTDVNKHDVDFACKLLEDNLSNKGRIGTVFVNPCKENPSEVFTIVMRFYR